MGFPCLFSGTLHGACSATVCLQGSLGFEDPWWTRASDGSVIRDGAVMSNRSRNRYRTHEPIVGGEN